MHFDFSAVKKHPAIIAVILFGAFIVYRLLNSSGSNAAQVPAQSAVDPSHLAAVQGQTAEQVAQIQADAVSKQTDASVAISQNQLEAQLAQIDAAFNLGKYQTDAQVTTAGMQQQVQDAAISAASYQKTIDDATINAQTYASAQIENKYLDYSHDLATTAESNYEANVQAIIPHAGDKKNSALDATDQTALFQTILASGNPSVAATGTSASASADASGNGASVAKTTAIAGAVSGIAQSIVKGLFV